MENKGFLNSRIRRLSNEFFFWGTVGLLLLSASFLSGCSTATTFRVLDAETMAPIEGAVSLATWTGYGGLPGLSYGYTAKALEAVSDKDGYCTMPGITGKIALNTPLLQVYKPSYVGWNSRRIYIGYYKVDRKLARTKERENFGWEDQDIYLEPWKDDGTMNHYTHSSFVRPDGDIYRGGLKDSKYDKATDYEVMKKRQERSLLKERR